MSEEHNCPNCGTSLPYYDRYPWYFCADCLELAEDANGRRVIFRNVSFSGGLSWAYAEDTGDTGSQHSKVICLIGKRPVLVQEARFGGVVAQPMVLELIGDSAQTIDLTKVIRHELVSKAAFSLPTDWYDLVISAAVQTHLPDIYEWNIEGAGIYIGKYTSISRPTREYTRNVERLINGQKYRRSNADGFRRIHRELASAVLGKRRITLSILENTRPEDLDRRERELIAQRGNLNGSIAQ